MRAKTLVDLVLERADSDPEAVSYTCLDDFDGVGGWREQPISNRELRAGASALAARIRRVSAPGDRVLLLNQPGPHYLTALYACLLAGTVAVPAYPPGNTHLGRAAERIDVIMADSRPSCAVVDEGVEVARFTRAGVQVITPSTVADEFAESLEPPRATPDAIAVLQYTSGSTGSPKGVALSHANVLANLRAAQSAFGVDQGMNGVFWLPPYHDMGLVGGIFMALFTGGHSRLFAPLAFLRDPLRWVSVMSKYGADTSAAPDFAYKLCARAARARPDAVAHLDLSRWRVAISGAEPVRADTLDDFADAFAPHGFRRESFRPAFGLAESTLLVSAGHDGGSVVRFDAAGLERGSVRPAQRDEPTRRLVGCGSSVDDAQRVVVVDPSAGTPCAAGGIGEIWVSGPSVARGYWRGDAVDEEVFGAALDGRTERFLRTGDLGFVHEGELFVLGRLKDLIVIRGRNHHPQDIEATAEAAHVAIRTGRCAAFPVDRHGEERLVVAVEDRRAARSRRAEVAAAVRDAVGREHGVDVHEVVFVPTGGILRTSSGKLRRSAVRDGYLAGRYPAEERARAAHVAPRDAVERAIAEVWSSVLEVPDVGVHDRFFELGGDSLKAVAILEQLNRVHHHDLALSDLVDAHTVADLARVVGARAAAAADLVRIDLG